MLYGFIVGAWLISASVTQEYPPVAFNTMADCEVARIQAAKKVNRLFRELLVCVNTGAYNK